ncbi:MAG: DUF5684 domain-containing protein [Parcubacteria group bacterium]
MDYGLTDYGADYGSVNPSVADPAELAKQVLTIIAPIMVMSVIISIAVAILMIIARWKVYAKAGKHGWAAIVPFYNTIVFVQTAKAPMWYLVFLWAPILGFIPIIGWLLVIASIVFRFMINIKLAKAFGKDAGFGVGLTLLPVVFMPMLGFGKAQYLGTPPISAAPATPTMPQTPPVA